MEALKERLMLDDNDYIGTYGGSWSDSSNWALGRLPTTDNAQFLRPTTVHIDANAVAGSLEISGNLNVTLDFDSTLAAHRLNLTGDVKLDQSGGTQTGLLLTSNGTNSSTLSAADLNAAGDITGWSYLNVDAGSHLDIRNLNAQHVI